MGCDHKLQLQKPPKQVISKIKTNKKTRSAGHSDTLGDRQRPLEGLTEAEYISAMSTFQPCQFCNNYKPIHFIIFLKFQYKERDGHGPFCLKFANEVKIIVL